jgi:hypothetical protein
LPGSLTHLIFKRDSVFSHSLSEGILPDSLLYVCLGMNNYELLPSFICSLSAKYLGIYKNNWDKPTWIDINKLLAAYVFKYVAIADINKMIVSLDTQ